MVEGQFISPDEVKVEPQTIIENNTSDQKVVGGTYLAPSTEIGQHPEHIIKLEDGNKTTALIEQTLTFLRASQSEVQPIDFSTLNLSLCISNLETILSKRQRSAEYIQRQVSVAKTHEEAHRVSEIRFRLVELDEIYKRLPKSKFARPEQFKENKEVDTLVKELHLVWQKIAVLEELEALLVGLKASTISDEEKVDFLVFSTLTGLVEVLSMMPDITNWETPSLELPTHIFGSLIVIDKDPHVFEKLSIPMTLDQITEKLFESVNDLLNNPARILTESVNEQFILLVDNQLMGSITELHQLMQRLSSIYEKKIIIG